MDHAAWPSQDLVDWPADQKAKFPHVYPFVDLLKKATPAWFEPRGGDDEGFLPFHVWVAAFLVC